MGNPQLKLVSSESEESAYGKPLTNEDLQRLSGIVSTAQRIKSASAGSFITTTKRSELVKLLQTMSAQAQDALKAIQGARR